MIETCKTCRFFDVAKNLFDTGKCRKNPPKVGFGYFFVSWKSTNWPDVDGEIDWCGKYEPDEDY